MQNKKIPFNSIAATSLTHQIFSDIRNKAEGASRKLADEYGLWIIEDACHALGARYNDLTNDKVGNSKYSDLSVFPSISDVVGLTNSTWCFRYLQFSHHLP